MNQGKEEEMAKTMWDSIIEFVQKKKSSYLQFVGIAIYYGDRHALETFKSQFKSPVALDIEQKPKGSWFGSFFGGATSASSTRPPLSLVEPEKAGNVISKVPTSPGGYAKLMVWAKSQRKIDEVEKDITKKRDELIPRHSWNQIDTTSRSEQKVPADMKFEADREMFVRGHENSSGNPNWPVPGKRGGRKPMKTSVAPMSNKTLPEESDNIVLGEDMSYGVPSPEPEKRQRHGITGHHNVFRDGDEERGLPKDQYTGGNPVEADTLPEPRIAVLGKKERGKGALRKDGEFPSNWTSVNTSLHFELVDVPCDHPEYQTVKKELTRSLSARDIKVQRVQNPVLYKKYVIHKGTMTDGGQHEQDLWHGAKADDLETLNMYSFNRSAVGKDGDLGEGLYFAKNALDCIDENVVPDPQTDKKHIYLCKVLTGVFAKGSRGLRVPPVRSGRILFDSTVNDEDNPTMFVIFNDTQVYPEYLITYI